ncbi:hypothetical protein JAAARDRAFT_385142 [Jaapia argillacea MUCL 33604]|uniref:Cytochrome P450 n=1 Tax=Jaapia argillacea MUCL 33604 TaxID=933084 RepID=A0A067QJD3_9AGAM|nr:hypothetical protein JAAARDRAFT_385142 [Jaapia argillacea MUCL 33604]
MAVTTILGALLLFIVIAVQVHRWFKRQFIKDIQGPPSSFFLGNELDINHQDQVGDSELTWIQDYGTAWRTGGCFGEDVLMTVDPKALQHVFQVGGYNYPKPAAIRQTIRMLMGRGIVWAAGDDHFRQRKIMNPAFQPAQLRSFLPVFRQLGSDLCNKWKDNILTTDAPQVIDVVGWLSRATLDAMGVAAFDYQFRSLDDTKDELLSVFTNLFSDSVLHPSKFAILFVGLWSYVPSSWLYYVQYIPSRECLRFRHYLKLASKVAKELIDEKTERVLAGRAEKSKDAMTVLVQANLSEDPKRRLDDDEMISQMMTLMLAGYETTSTTLGYFLWELSKHPEWQDRIREEIISTQAKIAARGEQDFTIADMEGMEYLNAALKETLRLHPTVYTLKREAEIDDIIPLAYPIKTKSGKMVSEIPIRKGQNILVSIWGYNHLKQVWGQDAEFWKPERFMGDKQERETSVGVYANTMSFSAGVRSCIGWRFALIEMQAILIELLLNFEFSLSPEKPEIQRMPAFQLMIPVLKNKVEEGTQLPLQVTIIR